MRIHQAACSILLILAMEGSPAYADTLMKGNHPVFIGWGEGTEKGIRWTNCERTESVTYDAPPYWVDKNHFCDGVKAQDLGIEEENGRYVVVDAKEFSKYFPAARKGDVAGFERVSGGVALSSDGQRLLLLSLSGREASFAQDIRLFDGTWMMKLDTAKFPVKPDKYTLAHNEYQCVTCVPKVEVKADGTDQKVTGHPFYDSVAVRVVDASSVEIVEKKDGKVVYTDKQTVSADGKTLNDKFTDTTGTQPVTGEVKSTRVSEAPAGSHALSGAWRASKVNTVSSNGLTVTYQTTADGLKMSDPNGNSYDAKFDGKDYPIQGDPGHTTVSLKRIGNDTIEETDKRDGKVVGVYRMTLSSDGKSIQAVYEDKEHGTTMAFTMEKQS